MPWVVEPGPHPLLGPAREAPSGSRRRRRREACPPCRAAPTSSGCRPPLARRRSAGRGERQCRAASHLWATSRAPRSPGGAASTVKPVGRIVGGATAVPVSVGGGCAGRGGSNCLLGGGDGILAVGQVVERLTRVARCVQACPAHQYVRPAVVHLELGQLLHLVLWHAFRASRLL